MALLYESLDEVVKIIRQPVPEEARQSGFEQAKKQMFFSTARYCFDSGACRKRLTRPSTRRFSADKSSCLDRGINFRPPGFAQSQFIP
jgi:hypothetical protein